MGGMERRRHSREQLYGDEQECIVFCLGKEYEGRVYDISKCGLCIEVDVPSNRLLKGRCIEIQSSYTGMDDEVQIVYARGTIVYSDEASWGARIIGVESYSTDLSTWVENVRTKRFMSKIRSQMKAG